MAFLVALVVVLALYNNLTNLAGMPSWLYVPLNLAAAAALLALARARGHGWDALGFDRAALGPGLRWGAVAFGVVAVALAIAWFVPGSERLLSDRRVAGLGGGGLAYTLLVRIPLGTALWEEIAFRGVLLGVWSQHASTATAVIGSSLVFGLWHVGPTIETLRINGVALGSPTMAAGVAGSVVATAFAGIVFCLLRLHSGGLVAPVLAHVATNSLGTVAAVLAQRGS